MFFIALKFSHSFLSKHFIIQLILNFEIHEKKTKIRSVHVILVNIAKKTRKYLNGFFTSGNIKYAVNKVVVVFVVDFL
jgi:hypothetical protein